MRIFKKAFLFFVGAVVVAVEETTKIIKNQQAKLEKSVEKINT